MTLGLRSCKHDNYELEVMLSMSDSEKWRKAKNLPYKYTIAYLRILLYHVKMSKFTLFFFFDLIGFLFIISSRAGENKEMTMK